MCPQLNIFAFAIMARPVCQKKSVMDKAAEVHSLGSPWS